MKLGNFFAKKNKQIVGISAKKKNFLERKKFLCSARKLFHCRKLFFALQKRFSYV